MAHNIFTDCYDELIKGELELFRENDLSSFVRNANFNLTNKILMPINTITLEKYLTALQSTIGHLEAFSFNAPVVTARLNELKNTAVLDSIKCVVPEFSYKEVGELKPVYIRELIEMIGKVIDSILKDDNAYENNKIRKIAEQFASTEVTAKVKRQVTTTNKEYYNYTAKNIYSIKRGTVVVDESVINTQFLPFCDTYEKEYNKTMVQLNALKTAIMDVDASLKRYIDVLNNVLKDDTVNTRNVEVLYYYVYNAVNTLINVVSFSTTMAIKKADWLLENARTCMEIVDKYGEYVVARESAYVTESAFERNNVSTDPHIIAANMMNGKVDVYQSLSNDIIDYHKAMSTNELSADIINDDFHSSFDYKVDEYDYEHTVYDNACKVYIEITNSLEIIAANSDDVLLIFDDIIQKAGLGSSLLDKYKTEVSLAKEIPQYTSAVNVAIDGVNNDNYFIMLKEVKDFPGNMNQFSNIVKDTKTVLMNIKARFEGNDIGDTFKNSAAAVELRTYIDTLAEEYDTLVELFAANFLERLRAISVNLEKLAVIQDDKKILKGEEINYESESFAEALMDSYIALFEAETDDIFRQLVFEYQVEKEYAERGVRLVLEDGEQPATKPATEEPAKADKPTVKDNNEAKNTVGNNTQTVTGKHDPDKTSAKFGNIVEVIRKFITGMIESLSAWITKDADKKWFEQNITVNGETMTRRAYLEARCNKSNGFNSVQVACPEFERLYPHKNLVSNFDKIISSAGQINFDQIKTEVDARKKVYDSIGIKLSNYEDKDTIGSEIINFCKHGNVGAPENKTYANSDVKNCVMEGLTYCDYYYGSFAKEMTNVSGKIDNALAPLQGKVVTESVCMDDFVEMYLREAEEAAANQTATTQNTEVKNDDKMKWISTAIQIFARAVTISAKQRKVAYMSILKGLCNQPSAEAPAEPENKPEEKTEK